jgi:hypothetical protein
MLTPRGAAPPCVHATATQFLNLCGCDFEGAIPDTLGDLANLQELKLSGNR